MKKLMTIAVAAILIFSISFCTLPGIYAHADLRDQLAAGQSKLSALKKQMNELQGSINTAQAAVNRINGKIVSTNAKIADLNNKITEQKKQLDRSEEVLDARLRAIYKSGSIGFVEILFASEDASELITNVEMVRKIYENDQNIVKEMTAQYDQLKTRKAEVDKLRVSLQSQKAEASKKTASLNSKKSKLNATISRVVVNNVKIRHEIEESEADADRLASSGGDTGGTYSGGAFGWPSPSHNVTSPYGWRMCPFHGWECHSGIDIGIGYGAPIYAAASGTVILSSYNGSFGNCVKISHGSGIQTLYGHCSSLLVSSGQHVTRGQVIARVGSTGNSTGPHLHFSVIKNGAFVNPMNYL